MADPLRVARAVLARTMARVSIFTLRMMEAPFGKAVQRTCSRSRTKEKNEIPQSQAKRGERDEGAVRADPDGRRGSVAAGQAGLQLRVTGDVAGVLAADLLALPVVVVALLLTGGRGGAAVGVQSHEGQPYGEN